MKKICKHAYPSDLCGTCNPPAKEKTDDRLARTAGSPFSETPEDGDLLAIAWMYGATSRREQCRELARERDEARIQRDKAEDQLAS